MQEAFFCQYLRLHESEFCGFDRKLYTTHNTRFEGKWKGHTNKEIVGRRGRGYKPTGAEALNWLPPSSHTIIVATLWGQHFRSEWGWTADCLTNPVSAITFVSCTCSAVSSVDFVFAAIFGKWKMNRVAPKSEPLPNDQKIVLNCMKASQWD